MQVNGLRAGTDYQHVTCSNFEHQRRLLFLWSVSTWNSEFWYYIDCFFYDLIHVYGSRSGQMITEDKVSNKKTVALAF